MLASDPDFIEVDILNCALAQLANPTMGWGNWARDLPEAERAAARQSILDKLDELLAYQDIPGVFRDWLKGIV